MNNECSWARIFSKLFLKRYTFGSKSGTKSLVGRYEAKFAKTVSEPFYLLYIEIFPTKKRQLNYMNKK